MTSVSQTAATTPSERLTIERLVDLRRPVEVELSPDGRRVAFTVAPAATEKGEKSTTRLWVGDVDGEPEPLAGEDATEGIPRFAPDGSALAFASDAGHHGRMSLRLEGRGELGTIPGSVEDARWSRDGSALLVLAADVGSDRAGVQTARKIEEQGAGGDDDPRVIRPAQHWRRLFLVDAATGETRQVSPEGTNVFEFDWVGGDAVVVYTDDPSESGWYSASLGLLDVRSRTLTPIHQPLWQLQCPRITPEGRVAWIEGLGSDRGVVTGTVFVLGGGALAPELDVTWLSFADEETLWYAGWRRSSTVFGRLALDGTIEEIHCEKQLVGLRYQPRIAPSADGRRIAAAHETTDEAPEVAVYEDGVRRSVTDLNGELTPLLASVEWSTYTWASREGMEIEGLLARPRERTDDRLPLVLYLHGGPTATWSWRVVPQPALLAQEGYAVLLPNPRGSVGRGQDFARANIGDLGGGDLRDVLDGVDALVREGIADDDRLAITGGSYGGFLSAWAVTQTDRFAAAVPYAVSSNWLSYHLTTNIGRFDELFLDADPYDAGGNYVGRSPVYHARNCTTPTLILQGENDLCTPLSQAFELYNALVGAGCETELVVYPREGHGWVEREHQIDVWRRTRDWLNRYLGPSRARSAGA
jgi:dipeptidyl aminopeptidase/acylaminoacyl peptidase